MKANHFFSFSLSLLLLAIIVRGEEVEKRKHSSTTGASNATSTTTQETTTKVTTIAPSGNVTTTAATSSSTSTPSKSTTTVRPASTTVAPIAGDYIGFDTSSNRTCIRLHADIKLAIPYPTKNNKTNVAHVEVPFDAKVNEVCYAPKQEIRLSWDNIGDNSSTFVLRFVKDNSTTKYSLVLVEVHILTFDSKVFPNITGDITAYDLTYNESVFSTPLNTSYTCRNLSGIVLTNKKLNQSGLVEFEHLQVQAYGFNKTVNTYSFDSALDCAPTPTPSTPDIVPIVVGCALALLVIIVLIAYLISRRRSQARGYLSM